MGVIYCYHCLVNGKKYIGLTNNLHRRQTCHRSNVETNKYPNIPFYNAVSLYGWDNFVCGVIEECDKDVMGERERYWIDYYSSICPGGYNVRAGGTHNAGYTGVRKKRGPMPEEHKKKISESAKGRVITQEMRDKISKTLSANHPNTSTWELTFESGEVVLVTNLKKWCRENDYSASCLGRVYKNGKGRHKDIVSIAKACQDTKASQVR